MKKAITVIGIDIGLNKKTFFSVWRDGEFQLFGSVATKEQMMKKILCYDREAKKLNEEIVVVIEDAYLGRNAQIFRRLVSFVAAIKYFCECHGIKCMPVLAQVWQTKAVRGLKSKMGSQKRKICSLRQAFYITNDQRLREELCLRKVKRRKTKRVEEIYDFTHWMFDAADAINIGFYGVTVIISRF